MSVPRVLEPSFLPPKSCQRGQLTHIWRFDGVPAGVHALRFEAQRPDNAEGDNFQFAWSDLHPYPGHEGERQPPRHDRDRLPRHRDGLSRPGDAQVRPAPAASSGRRGVWRRRASRDRRRARTRRPRSRHRRARRPRRALLGHHAEQALAVLLAQAFGDCCHTRSIVAVGFRAHGPAGPPRRSRAEQLELVKAPIAIHAE